MTDRTRLLLFTFGFALLTGCGGTSPTTGSTKTTGKEVHSHGDGGVAGGVLVEWGEDEYHAEFAVDHGPGEATVYILDGTAKKVLAIPAESITLTLKESPPVVVTLTPKPQDGDPAGKSSRFVGTHEVLKTVKEFSGSISGVVNGKPYTGDFAEKPAGKE